MATTTTNFGWDIPQSTDLVKDGATAIAALGQDIDTALVDLKGGTTGQVLSKASGTDLDYTWVAVDPLLILDAKGDLITATAADTPARLPVGANGTVLTADSAQGTGLTWSTPASGGMTLLSTTTLTGTSTTVSSISGAYKELKIYVKDFYTSSNADLNIQLNGSTTGSHYMQNVIRSVAPSTNGTYIDNATAGFTVNGYSNGTTSQDNFSYIVIPDYANATTNKVFNSFSTIITNAGSKSVCLVQGGFYGSIAAITSITFVATVGTFSAGSVEIYGVK